MQKGGAKRKPKNRIIDDGSDEDAYEPSAKKVCILKWWRCLEHRVILDRS